MRRSERSQAAVPVFPACTVRPGRSSKASRAPVFPATEIVTDVPSVYEEIQAFLIQNGLDSQITLRRYDDPQLPLPKLYSFSSVLGESLRERVWLKSGGHLVIQPTEALTVIDVNTGKYDGKKKPEEAFLKINLEAAKEAARQLRCATFPA